MWNFHHEQTSNLSVEAIWRVLADVKNWPQVDQNIERLVISEEPAPGVRFMLKPRGGPRLNFTIGSFEAPHRYSDVCVMPGARMETIHRLASGPVTTIAAEIEIRGPLAWLWGRVVGQKHAQGLPALTQKMLAFAAGRNESAGIEILPAGMS
jgi:Polyketide cyclase / dehydrase and lipid transport